MLIIKTVTVGIAGMFICAAVLNAFGIEPGFWPFVVGGLCSGEFVSCKLVGDTSKT